MIKAIQYHLADCPEYQAKLERDSAAALNQRKARNQIAFQTMMPNLAVVFTEEITDELGLFCNKYGELNLVNQSSGQVVYGLHPRTESEADIQAFIQQAPHIKLSGGQVPQVPLLRAFQLPESKGFVPALPLTPLPQAIDTVIMLGLGLGHSLETFLRLSAAQLSVRNLVIYEPTLDFFRASVQAADWHFILTQAAEQNIRLFLQVGQTAENIGQDLQELQNAFQAEDVYIYKHYHHEVMDAVFDALMQPNFSLVNYLQQPAPHELTHTIHYLPMRAGAVKSTLSRPEAEKKIAAALALKEKNLAAFALEFPDLHQELSNYTPLQWHAFIDDSGEFNLYHERRLGALYHAQPSLLSSQTLALFAAEPNRNDMFTGYKGGKLRHYIHFTHARKLGALAEQLELDGQFVSENISSLIWFGLGLGYQLAELIETYDIQSLYIYEPNPDFLYWSLLTVPWHELLPQQRALGMHWYINLGDDGQYLQEDIFQQFQSSGGYLTASTYFYLPFHVPHLQPHIRQLRRDLQSYLMLCEYFDHVRYSFRHTEKNLRAGMRLLKKSAQLPAEYAAMPIVVVGNGPSLDMNIALLKQRRDEFLVVSCGTALKALYEAGITPDFHSDVEQNRATYSWIMQVQDTAWLKQITLLSLTSIHPDSAALFKEQLAVFKYGEASTAAFLRRSGLSHQLEVLDYCYPTVTNLALSLLLKLGFQHIYLLGVDLGFKHHDHHHSKGSAYYKKDSAKSWHDYRKSAGQGIPVAGNFTPIVLTKYEFQLARRIMEQLLRDQPQTQVVNCSDGALIAGTISQPFVEVPQQVKLNQAAVCQWLKQEVYTDEGVDALIQVLADGFQLPQMQAEANELLAITHSPVHSREEALQRLEKEKIYLLKLYEDSPSLWFYLIYASSHFASSALVRFLYTSPNEEQALSYFEQGSEIWRDYIQAAIDSCIAEPDQLDQTLIKYLPHALPAHPTTP